MKRTKTVFIYRWCYVSCRKFKKQTMVVHTSNPSTQVVEAGRSWVQGSLSYIQRLCLIKKEKAKEISKLILKFIQK
jgi:hypothetical protein